MRYTTIHTVQTIQPYRMAQRGTAGKDGAIEHASTERQGHRPAPAHPDAARNVHPGPAAPRGTSAWRQANSQKPDTLLPGNGGAFSNGDRRRCAARGLERQAH